MKDYRHMMRQVTLSDEKKEKIMELLENGSEQKRRHIPKAARIALAAALVLVCMMSIAAAADLPLVPSRIYYFLGGGSLTVIPGEDVGIIGEITDGEEIILSVPDPEDAPLVLEDGRLWFVGGGERTDVTDLIDADTPYIYEHTDPVTGYRGWLILGGTPEDFGWAEYADVNGGSGLTGNNFSQIYLTLDGEKIRDTDLTREQRERTNQMDSVPTEVVYAPWLVSAMEQLGIEHY